MPKQDDFKKILKRDALRKEIKELKDIIVQKEHELHNIEAYFDNKAKVKNVIGYDRHNGNKPLLGLNNKRVYHPSAYCWLKGVYLLYDDIRDKRCFEKGCKHLIRLSETEAKEGIKYAPQIYFDSKVSC